MERRGDLYGSVMQCGNLAATVVVARFWWGAWEEIAAKERRDRKGRWEMEEG